jgi:gliding motility-associated-like protein
MAKPFSSVTYYVVAPNANGCPSTDSVRIVVRTLPPADAGSDVFLCLGDSVMLTATGGNGYQWSPASAIDNPSLASPSVFPDTTTMYYVEVSDGFCTAKDSMQVTVSAPRGDLDAGESKTIYKGDYVLLSATGGAQYLWSPPGMVDCAACGTTLAGPRATTTYHLEALDQNGCRVSDSLTVTVLDDIFMYIPSSFTPNEDGINDYFSVTALPLSSFSISVYNRWGTMVFQSSSQYEGWDGRYLNEKVEQGVYSYMLRASTVNGDIIDKVGSVTLIR